MKTVNGILEVSAALAILVVQTEQLLRIIEGKRTVCEGLHSIVAHIALQLREIEWSPGHKNIIISAPFQKLRHDIDKGITLSKLVHLQMNQGTGDLMHTRINLRLNQLVKLGQNLSILV